jgi:hypothetical protein
MQVRLPSPALAAPLVLLGLARLQHHRPPTPQQAAVLGPFTITITITIPAATRHEATLLWVERPVERRRTSPVSVLRPLPATMPAIMLVIPSTIAVTRTPMAAPSRQHASVFLSPCVTVSIIVHMGSTTAVTLPARAPAHAWRQLLREN